MTAIAAACAVVALGLAAWDFGRRWVGLRLEQHKLDTHELEQSVTSLTKQVEALHQDVRDAGWKRR